MVSYDWHKPIPPACYPRLILENKQPAWGVLKTICYDPCTRDRYFVKHYRKEVEYRARREDLGLTLCGSYGASTPGHLLIYDKCIPVLIQRLIPFTKTVGDIYREHPDKDSFLPDEKKRADLLSALSTKQVTEVLVCWIMDFLIFNWDPHPDNYLLDQLGGTLVGVDKGLTGSFIGHPHLLLDSPTVDGDLVHYVARVSKPVNNVLGHIYEPVFTNMYRRKYIPHRETINSIMRNVEQVGGYYDSQIRSVLDRSGLEAFTSRRNKLSEAITKLFNILGLEI